MICEICNDGREYVNLGVHMKKHGETAVNNAPVINAMAELNSKPQVESSSKTEQMFGQIMDAFKGFDKRLNELEIKAGGRDNRFKGEARVEDIEAGKIARKDVDPRLVKIVDEILGEDFGIEIEPRDGQPGFLFTVLVPQRLSELSIKTRPIKGEDGEYVIDPKTKTPKEEEYWPEDRRSRAIASYQSFDAIREHCERVRAYIVSWYQKMSRPLPEFKLKQYV